MNLKLHKPLCIFDLETTGINISKDRIVEIAIVKIGLDGTKQVKRRLVNPEMPIPKASSDVHGITDEMVKDAASFKIIANEIKQFIEGSDIGGYNSNRFDVPMLNEEFLRAGISVDIEHRKLLDVQKVFHMMEQSNLIVVNVARSLTIDLLLSFLHMGDNKIWFYVDPNEVDKNIMILLNTVNANVFSSSDEFHSMLTAFIGNA